MIKNFKISLIVLLIFMSGCGVSESEQQIPSIMRVNVIKPFSIEVLPQLKLYGTVVAKDSVAISSSLQGLMILNIKKDVGEWVNAGEILAQLEDNATSSELEQNKANLERFKAELMAHEASLKEAVFALNRQKILLKDNATSKQEFEQQEAKVITVKANIKSTKANIAEIIAKIKNSTHQQNKTEIKAPVSGIITKRTAVSGALVGSDALFHIAKDGILELEVDADVSEITKLTPNLKAQINTKNLKTHGTIRLISPELDSNSRLGKVRISMDANATLGSSVTATIMLTKRFFDINLPISAIAFDANGMAFVRVLNENNQIYKKGVKIGETNSDLVQIVDGISLDDKVVFQAGAFLDDGDVIEPVLVDFKAQK